MKNLVALFFYSLILLCVLVFNYNGLAQARAGSSYYLLYTHEGVCKKISREEVDKIVAGGKCERASKKATYLFGCEDTKGHSWVLNSFESCKEIQKEIEDAAGEE